MIKINLVPRELLAKEQGRQRNVQAAAVIIVVCFLAVIVTWARYAKMTRLEKLQQSREAELDRLKQIVAEVEQLERTASAVRTRLSVITDLLKGRPLYPYFMTDLVKTIPNDIHITGLNTTDKGAGALGVQTQAVSQSSESIAEWLRSIEKSGKFFDPVLSAVTVGDAGGGLKNHAFSVTMTYRTQL